MIKDTLFASYIKERQGAEILEDDSGFIIYRVNGPECYIIDMAVAKSERRQGRGKDLIGLLRDIALFHECELITAHIRMFDPKKSKTLLAALKTGFEVIASDAEAITIALRVKE